MYNRYIPQPDGTYRRNTLPDPIRPKLAKQPEIPKCQQADESCAPIQHPSQPPKKEPHCNNKQDPCTKRKEPEPCHSSGSIGSFFKQLLPKDFDTGDLLIVLLLLLMAGDCADDQNTALLTLVLYLFM